MPRAVPPPDPGDAPRDGPELRRARVDLQADHRAAGSPTALPPGGSQGLGGEEPLLEIVPLHGVRQQLPPGARPLHVPLAVHIDLHRVDLAARGAQPQLHGAGHRLTVARQGELYGI